MKKIKHIIPFLIVLILALAIPLAACGSCKKKGNNSKTLQSISVNADNVKSVYGIGDEVSTEGLVVTAHYLNSKSKVVDEVLGADAYQVYAPAFTAAGTYSITVSYTYEEVTEADSYEVNVVDYFDGLEVSLVKGVLPVPEGAEDIDTFALSQSQPTVEIDTSKIVVKEINKDGSVGETITDYEVSLYNGQEKIALTNGKATVGGGAYAIWAEKASDVYSKPRRAFALVYVNDDIQSFAFKSGTTKQEKGTDVISDTWVFKATYASGATKDIPASECDFDLNTMAVATNKQLEVKYTDYNAKGTATDKVAKVTYSISKKYGKTVYTYDYSAIDYSNMDGEGPLTQKDLSGVNSFLRLGSGSNTYRNKTEWGVGADTIEIKKEGFTVTLDGTGYIIIGFSSTGGSNWSRVGLRDSSENYIEASEVTTQATEAVKKLQNNQYEVYGTEVSVLKFEISEPGIYSIYADTEIGRGCRIHSIVMEDNVEPAPAALNNIDSANQTYIVKRVEKV